MVKISNKMLWVRLLCGILCLSLLMLLPVETYATEKAIAFRIGGQNRYETAFAIADAILEQLAEEKFSAVVLASGKNFPDALTGSKLAASVSAPILLVNESEQTALCAYLQKNLVPGGKVYILGGSVAVPQGLEEKLADYCVVRLAGPTRYETNLAVLQETGVSGGEILVCTGRDFADSLSASATNKPILLVDGEAGSLTTKQLAYLASLKDPVFCLIGGKNVLPATVEAQLAQYGAVKRIDGATRYETSVLVAQAFFPNPQQVTFACGSSFPDGLCGGPFALAVGGPVILADIGREKNAQAYVQACAVACGVVLGGTARISDASFGKILSLPEGTIIEEWGAEKQPGFGDLAVAKPENVAKVQAYAQKLYSDNISDDYVHAQFTWDNKVRTSNWIYFTGLVFDALLVTDFDAYNAEIREFFRQHIEEDGTIRNYIAGELDSAMLPGVMITLLNSGQLTPEEQELYNAAANYVYCQLENQTIYPEAGNLWLHSQKADGTPRPAWVKWNVCLDGVFMSQIFLVRLADAIDNGYVQIVSAKGDLVSSEQLRKDIYSRLTFVVENMQDLETGLLNHGYCVETGETNDACWSRGMGWYTMVLMESAERFPEGEEKRVLIEYYQQLMEAVMRWQDPATGLWYNVTDGREEYAYRCVENGVETVIYNMPESSGSAMFAYCLLRGYHNGLLENEKCRLSGLAAFNALVETKMTENGLTDIYSSSSVTGNKDLYQKNGYVANDGKGVGPFIMAAVYAR